MEYITCYWDEKQKCQKERPCTPDEISEIETRKANPDTSAINSAVLAELEVIDSKSIRALREGNADRIQELEKQAAALRLQLIK